MEKESVTEVKVKNEKKEIAIINEETIKDKIYIIRDQQVMLDFDLAELYGYTTKAFNQQVKNNIEKFPADFVFRLVDGEIKQILRSKKLTAKTLSSKRRYLPYAFTEQGIYMLMTVLKGELAVQQSIRLIRAFKAMKDYISESASFLTNTNEYLENKFTTIDKRFEVIEGQIEEVMTNFIDPSTYKPLILMNGKRIEAAIAYQNIYSKAKQSILIVDDYIDVYTLQLLKICPSHIKITIYSDNVARNKLEEKQINDFIKETGISISIYPTHEFVHDRYIFIDYNTNKEKMYLSGPSSKDAGNRIATILEMEFPEIYHPIIDKIKTINLLHQ